MYWLDAEIEIDITMVIYVYCDGNIRMYWQDAEIEIEWRKLAAERSQGSQPSNLKSTP